MRWTAARRRLPNSERAGRRWRLHPRASESGDGLADPWVEESDGRDRAEALREDWLRPFGKNRSTACTLSSFPGGRRVDLLQQSLHSLQSPKLLSGPLRKNLLALVQAMQGVQKQP